MKMRGDKCHPDRGKRVKIPLLPNNVGKLSVNNAGPQQGHNKTLYIKYLKPVLFIILFFFDLLSYVLVKTLSLKV